MTDGSRSQTKPLSEKPSTGTRLLLTNEGDLFLFSHAIVENRGIEATLSGPGMASLAARHDYGGKDVSVRIPAGAHEVTFQLQSRQSNQVVSTRLVPAENALQGWIDDLRLVSPASHYAEWVAEENLPAELSIKDVDADHDGSSNFLEYSFGTDPRDGSSRPQPLEVTRYSSRWDASNQGLRLPYLPSHTEAVLQSSTDLVHWVDEPSVPSRHYPPEVSFWWFTPPELEYPFLKLPPGVSVKFFRIGILDPE